MNGIDVDVSCHFFCLVELNLMIRFHVQSTTIVELLNVTVASFSNTTDAYHIDNEALSFSTSNSSHPRPCQIANVVLERQFAIQRLRAG